MRIKLENWFLFICFDFPGFGYVHITGNNHQRKMYFIGFATIEALDKRKYPGIDDTTYTLHVFRRKEDGKLWVYNKETKEWEVRSRSIKR